MNIGDPVIYTYNLQPARIVRWSFARYGEKRCTIERASDGRRFTVTVRRLVRSEYCPICNGAKLVDGTNCPACKGTGHKTCAETGKPVAICPCDKCTIPF
jgi:hypothetical protein